MELAPRYSFKYVHFFQSFIHKEETFRIDPSSMLIMKQNMCANAGNVAMKHVSCHVWSWHSEKRQP